VFSRRFATKSSLGDAAGAVNCRSSRRPFELELELAAGNARNDDKLCKSQ